MVKVFKGTDKEFYMDDYLKTNLEVARKIIKKDWDMIFVVDGAEGSGKSLLTMQMGMWCDPSLTLDRIVFTPRDFKNAILEAKPYQTVVYDEAYTGLSSRATMSLINRTLITMLAEIRQRNLFVFIVMPCFFDLDKYAALWRSRALIHVYTGKNFQRGFFSFYNTEKKKALYMLGKKFYSYSKPKPNFRGRFTNNYTVDEQKYRYKKKNSLTQREKEKAQKEVKKELDGEIFERIMAMSDDIPHKFKMEVLGISASTYFHKRKAWKDNQELS